MTIIQRLISTRHTALPEHAYRHYMQLKKFRHNALIALFVLGSTAWVLLPVWVWTHHYNWSTFMRIALALIYILCSGVFIFFMLDQD